MRELNGCFHPIIIFGLIIFLTFNLGFALAVALDKNLGAKINSQVKRQKRSKNTVRAPIWCSHLNYSGLWCKMSLFFKFKQIDGKKHKNYKWICAQTHCYVSCVLPFKFSLLNRAVLYQDFWIEAHYQKCYLRYHGYLVVQHFRLMMDVSLHLQMCLHHHLWLKGKIGEKTWISGIAMVIISLISLSKCQ